MPTRFWTDEFRPLHSLAVSQYSAGQRDCDTFFAPPQREFLASIGLRPIFLYDHAEDFCGGGDPDYETTLLIASVRRDHFIYLQNGQWSDEAFDLKGLPERKAEFEGIAWLPRILAKARGFLRGNLPPDIMYNCGGDRDFLARHHCHPADFLRAVWGAGPDDRKVLESLQTAKR
ncbi:MAG: hypothetical protein WA771_08675 [Chthoniobacterales bacterium]